MTNKILGVIGGISGEALCESLHKRRIKCLLIAGKKNEAGLNKADYTIIEDLSHKEKILNQIRALGVTKIIVGTGHILALELAGYLEEHRILTSIDYKASMLAKNKILYKKRLLELGFKTPAFVCFKQCDEKALKKVLNDVGLPCVVKSAIDKFLPRKCASQAELRQALEDGALSNSEILAEKFIQGVDCTIPYVSDATSVVPLTLSYYSKAEACRLKGFGLFERHELPKEAEAYVIEYCKMAAKRIPTLGLGRIDAIVAKNTDVNILECNSVMVTGIHPNQIEYGLNFIKKEKIDFASRLLDVSLRIFAIKQKDSHFKQSR